MDHDKLLPLTCYIGNLYSFICNLYECKENICIDNLFEATSGPIGDGDISTVTGLVSVSAHRYLECLGTRLELVNDAQPKWANAVCMHEHARFNTSMAIPSEDIRFVL